MRKVYILFATLFVTIACESEYPESIIQKNVSVENVSLDYDSITLGMFNTKQLNVIFEPSDATNQNVTWESSNPEVANVTDGLVGAIGLGTSIISVITEDGRKTAKCEVTVFQPVKGISLDCSSLELIIGESFTPTVILYPEDATSKALAWYTSDSSVATIQGGVITAVGVGNATIGVIDKDSGKEATCKVCVFDPKLSLSDSEVTMLENDEYQITATISPATLSNIELSWASSNEAVATVSQEGKVTSHKEGTTVITVKTDRGNAVATCDIKVVIPVLSFDADTYEINKGEKRQLSVSVEPSSLALNKLIWTSSSEDVATVSSEGIVSAKKEGETIISVQTEDKKSIAQCKVIVTVIMPTGVKITNAVNSMLINERYGLLYEFEPEGAENIEIVWSSDNEAVLKVDENGTCLALSEGIATVSVSSLDGTIADSISITVKDPYKEVGVAYMTKYGLECTVHSIDISSDGGTTKCKISYTLKNITSDKIVTECSFLCTTENNEEVRQYGGLDNLYPGESTKRGYTFKTLTSDPFVDMKLHNPFDNPIIDSTADDLIWNLKQFYQE